MGKRIVVSFPGGRGYEIPLLYFCAKHFEDMGYEKLFIAHPVSGNYSLESLLENAERVLGRIAFDEYEDIVFIAKSIGTMVACKIKEKYSIPASLILFTPLPGTLPYINSKNHIRLVAAGANDRYLDPKGLEALCEAENVTCCIEPNVGHRMEVVGDLKRNLEIISNVMEQIR